MLTGYKEKHHSKHYLTVLSAALWKSLPGAPAAADFLQSTEDLPAVNASEKEIIKQTHNANGDEWPGSDDAHQKGPKNRSENC